jgi:undecaprenyl-diphosphatase
MWDYIFLGVLQGIFEWLPISSEGIVALTSNFLKKDINPIDIALFLHLGTLLAVMIYFWRDWKEVLTLRAPKFLRFLIISTIISLAIGYFLYNAISNVATGATLLLLTGIGLLFTAYFNKSKKNLGLSMQKPGKLAVITGILQGFAVIPGLSRSGSTIFGLSLSKLAPSEILKISYMMAAPVILASTAYIILKNPLILSGWPALISSFIVGLISLSLLMKLSEKINFSKFALLFALLCFIGAAIGFFV